jgi:hypothetical protein
LVTVVIVSYGRPRALLKQAEFLNIFNVKLIIVDGSAESLNFTDLSRFGYLTKYIHMPGEKNYLQRFIRGLMEVDTKYFCLMDDSDIVFPTALNFLATYLEKNSGFAATGQVYRMMTESGVIAVNSWGHWSNPINLDSEKAIQNIKIAFSEARTANIYYFVCPTSYRNFIIDSIEPLLAANYENLLGFFEPYFSAVILKKLKFRKLGIPFWVRCDYDESLMSHKRSDRGTLAQGEDLELFKLLLIRLLAVSENKSEINEKVNEIVSSLYEKTANFSSKTSSLYNLIARTKTSLRSVLLLLRPLKNFLENHSRSRRIALVLDQVTQESSLKKDINAMEFELKKKLTTEYYVAMSIWCLTSESVS